MHLHPHALQSYLWFTHLQSSSVKAAYYLTTTMSRLRLLQATNSDDTISHTHAARRSDGDEGM